MTHWVERSRAVGYRLSARPLRAAFIISLGLFAACGGNEGERQAESDSSTALPMDVTSLPELDKAKRYALLVGIGTYPRPEHGLPSPPFDLEATRNVLVKHFGFPAENVLVLRDTHATRDSIIWGFRNHLARAGPNGVAVFYFVGHGLRMDANYSVPDVESGSQDQGLFVRTRDNRGAVLLDDELNVLISGLGTKRAVVILDACYSGTGAMFWEGLRNRHDAPPPDESVLYVMSTTYGGPGDPVDLPAAFLSDGRALTPIESSDVVFLGAAEDTQQSYSVSRWPTAKESRSVFGYYFGRALQSGSSARSFLDLIAQTRGDIQRWDQCVSRGKCQNPQILGRLAALPIASVLGEP